MELDSSDLWRRIPPEEKFELMAQAHASGVTAALIALLVAGTIAVGLRMSPLFWGIAICTPFVFQYAAGKAWRGLRPRLMLAYLAARSAARRYAFSTNGKDLTVSYMFKGTMSNEFDQDNLNDMLQSVYDGVKEAEVWVSLFGDSIVMMSEGKAGALLQFSHLLDDKLLIETEGKEYSRDRAVVFSCRDKKSGTMRKIKLTSKYSAALVVFEKKIIPLHEQVKRKALGGAKAIPQSFEEEQMQEDTEFDVSSGSGW